MARSVLISLLMLAVGLGVGYLVGGARPASVRSTPVRSSPPANTDRPQDVIDPSPEVSSDLSAALRKLPVPNWSGGLLR